MLASVAHTSFSFASSNKAPNRMPGIGSALTARRRIWILHRDVETGHAGEVGAGRRVRGATMAAKR